MIVFVKVFYKVTKPYIKKIVISITITNLREFLSFWELSDICFYLPFFTDSLPISLRREHFIVLDGG